MGFRIGYDEKIYDFRDKEEGVKYYIENTLNKTVTMFKYKNLPETLPEREFELMLQILGKCIVAKDNDGNIVAFSGNYGPECDTYYRPKTFLVNNPWANVNKEFTFGEDCVLVRNDPLDRGLIPIIKKHGTMSTEVDLSLWLASINLRAIYAIMAGPDGEAESARVFLQEIEDGKPGVLVEELFSNGIKTQPFANSSNGYITQLIELKQYVDGKFLNDIGLNSNYNMKRERLSSNETELNEDSLRPLIDAMLEERQKALKKINEMFGTNSEVEFDSSWAKYNEYLFESINSEDVEDETEEVEENIQSEENIQQEEMKEVDDDKEVKDDINVSVEINIDSDNVDDNVEDKEDEDYED